MNLKTQYEICSAFLEVFHRCDPEYADEDEPSFMGTPATVCIAFSIEVGLKIILSACGKNMRGHNIFSLYKELPAHFQLQILEGTGFSKDVFMRELSYAKNAFNEWRYVFEATEPVSANLYFLKKLATAVQYVSEKTIFPRT